MNISNHRWATVTVTVLGIALTWWGLHLAFLPPVYQLSRPEAHYEAYILLILSSVLLLFFRRAVHGFIWLTQEMQRMISALLLMAAVGIDGVMHAFSIPHIEGWWLPVIGSGALFSFIRGYLQKLRTR